MRRYQGKKVRIRLTDGNEYIGTLRDVEDSKHGGVGNILLEDPVSGDRKSEWCTIRGSYVCYIVLPNEDEKKA